MNLEETSPPFDGWFLESKAELAGAEDGDQREREDSLLPATLNIVRARFSQKLGPRKEEREEARAQRKRGYLRTFEGPVLAKRRRLVYRLLRPHRLIGQMGLEAQIFFDIKRRRFTFFLPLFNNFFHLESLTILKNK